MKPSLSIGSPCRYWTDRPGCWQKGTVLDLDRHTVTVKPSRSDLDPVVLPRRQVKPLPGRARQAVAVVLAVLQERAPGVNPILRQPTDPSEIAGNCRVVYLGGQPRAVPPPPKRILSPKYLKWIGSHPCCVPGCGDRAQRHHYGPRGVGQKTDDPRTVPLCESCHLRYWHKDGTLPGYVTPEAARLFVLSQQVLFLQRYLTERGADRGELDLLLVRAQVDALVGFFSISQRRRAA